MGGQQQAVCHDLGGLLEAEGAHAGVPTAGGLGRFQRALLFWRALGWLTGPALCAGNGGLFMTVSEVTPLWDTVTPLRDTVARAKMWALNFAIAHL